MTIECYYGECKYHGTQSGDEGPFCFEEECRATSYEITLLEAIRKQYLELSSVKSQPVVAWRYRYVDPEEGPGVWQVTTDARDVAVVGGMSNYEVQQLVTKPI